MPTLAISTMPAPTRPDHRGGQLEPRSAQILRIGRSWQIAARYRSGPPDRRDLRDRALDQRHCGRAAARGPPGSDPAACRRVRKIRCSPNAPGCRGTPISPRRWITCSSAGRPSPAFSTTAASARRTMPLERALRGIAMRRSLYPSSSSIWKHWKLVCGQAATRTTCSLNRGSHPFLSQIVGTDLVRSARQNLLGGENTVLD